MKFLLPTAMAFLRHSDTMNILAPNSSSAEITDSDSVDTMTSKLTRIVSGLGKVQKAQKDTEFSKMISPYVEAMSKVLKQVHNSSSLSDEEKRKKLEHAQDSMGNLANDMATFGQHLIDDDANQQTSILLGVLLSRKDDKLERQMEVLTDKQFQHLPCVKYVEAHKTDLPLVQQVASCLDKNKKPTTPRNDVDLKQVPNQRHEMQSLLIQLSTFVEDCPYCKAQCIEKCHNEGHSFMQCLGSCADEGTDKQEKEAAHKALKKAKL